MATAKLELNGKEYELKPKARVWRIIMEFEEKRSELTNQELVDAYCNVISQAYNVPLDEILDSLPLEDVLPIYLETFNTIYNMLTLKLNKKNTVEELTT